LKYINLFCASWCLSILVVKKSFPKGKGLTA
jgi:hypothetical protein